MVGRPFQLVPLQPQETALLRNHQQMHRGGWCLKTDRVTSLGCQRHRKPGASGPGSSVTLQRLPHRLLFAKWYQDFLIVVSKRVGFLTSHRPWLEVKSMFKLAGNKRLLSCMARCAIRFLCVILFTIFRIAF
uniref:cDNA FLJ61761 n=1 Tax=Homo sapiens TaxID=9606 RepID=B7Z5B8_HUMAN|nr:unnamed protein product [Homo sapiens]